MVGMMGSWIFGWLIVGWLGIGFGLERMLMIAEKSRSLAKMGRSLGYLDGIRLNI